MVKRKTRNVPVPDAPIAGPSCVHVRKALDEGTVKKALVNVDWTICQDCVMDVKEKDGTEEESVERPAVWLCLQCGHRGCGRYSDHQHALNHYNTPRSVPHSLVLSTETWSVWCYACDAEVPFASMGRLGQLVGYIQKKSKTPNNAVLVEQEACASEKEEKPKGKAGEGKEEPPHQAVKVEKTANASSNNQEPTVKGLSNLGNTCFFNAVMQNLSQTPTLKELVNEVKLPQSVTVSLPDSSHQEVHLDQPPGPLTLAMCQFLMEMQETKKGVVTPKEVFSQVCKKAARFKGYQQQDSQELLRYLLDGMRGEEIQRISAATAKALHGRPGNLDEEEIKKKVKDCEKRRGFPNFIDRLFGGELTSTIMCEECHTVSLVHEPFLDLSLPVLDDVLTKKVSQKILKNVGLKKAEIDDEEEEDEEPRNGSYIKDNDEGSGTSKHLQKKAKKQAKKQAKSQRRQQKIQDKTVLFNNLCAGENGEGDENEEPHSSSPLESGTNSNLGSSASLDGTDSAAQERNAAPNIMDLESDPKFVLEKPSEDIKAADGELGSCTEVCKDILGDRDATCQEKSSETSAEDLEICNGTSVGDLENSMDVPGEDMDNGTGVSVGNAEYGTEVALGNLENGTAGGPDVSNSELLAQTKPPEPHTERVQEIDPLTEDLNRLNLGPIIEPSEIHLEIMHEPHASQVYEVVNEDPKTAFSTLSDRDGVQLEEYSVLSCLYQFTHKESLTGNNQLLCNVCTRKHASKPKNNTKDKKRVFTNAKKQMLISAPPPILTLHLKRFQQNGFNLHKINKHIKFPELIDLAPFCTLKCKNIRERDPRLLYSLYGVIEHSGTMRSGHYTAFIKLRSPTLQFCNLVLQGRMAEESRTDPPRGHWYHVSDSHVQPVPLSKVLSSQAYLLFYERLV